MSRVAGGGGGRSVGRSETAGAQRMRSCDNSIAPVFLLTHPGKRGILEQDAAENCNILHLHALIQSSLTAAVSICQPKIANRVKVEFVKCYSIICPILSNFVKPYQNVRCKPEV